jgi:hypothetical protein
MPLVRRVSVGQTFLSASAGWKACPTVRPLAAALLIALGLIAASPPASRAQNTQPVWYPPLSLYGRPVAQPYFDFPNWARYSHCRPAPLAWGYDPFPDYGPHDCIGQDVPTINCPGDFVAHRPNTWYASADFAPLMLSHQKVPLARLFVAEVPAFDANMDGDTIDAVDLPAIPAFFTDPIFGTDNLEPEFNAGGKFTVGRRIFGCYRIEGTYMGSYNWESAAAIHSDDPYLATMFSGFDIPADGVSFAGATDIFISNRSRMNSAEVNLRYWVDMPPGPFDVSFLVGGRYLRIDDGFRLVATDGVLTDDVQAETENSLVGVQIGAAGDVLLHPRFWMNFDLKVGIYDNQTSIVYQDAAVPDPVTGQANRTSFVGDIAIVGHWQMTPWLVFNLGYQFTIVDGIAVGFDNVVAPPFAAGVGGAATRFDDTGQITYHGPVIGLMGVW